MVDCRTSGLERREADSRRSFSSRRRPKMPDRWRKAKESLSGENLT